VGLSRHRGLAAYLPGVVRFFQNEGILGVLKADSLDLSGVERGEDVAAPIFSENFFGQIRVQQEDQIAVGKFSIAALAFPLLGLFIAADLQAENFFVAKEES